MTCSAAGQPFALTTSGAASSGDLADQVEVR